MRRCAAGVTLRPSGHPAAETGRREDAARQSPLYAFHPSPARKSQAAHAPPPSAGAARAPPPPHAPLALPARYVAEWENPA